jgi:phage terminase large subunit GpA-like protein
MSEQVQYEVSANSSPKFAAARSITKATAELYRPPRRMLPSEAAHKYLRNDKGSYDPSISPMMREPLDLLGGREYQGVVFVGPARSSKTYSLLLGGITYAVVCAPGDTLIVQMTADAARDFSRGDLDRSIRYSEELSKRLSPRARDDNTFAKYWRSGISLKVGWPAVSQLSSKTLQYVFITDYDRPENRDNVDGEGPMWDLAMKRIETYMSRGKCVAESSPGEELLDPQWRPLSAHEAPPVPGIFTLYNRGTRARWYWPCLHCGAYTEAKPGLEVFCLPPELELEQLVRKQDPMSLAEQFARVVCKECGGIHQMQDRHEMNQRGRWVHEGQRIEGDAVVGERRRSNIASYWLGGPAATYQRWDGLLQKYFQGLLAFTRSGDETSLKATTLTDQAAPFISRNLSKYRGPEAILERLEDWTKGEAPQQVRFLTAAVDVQAHKFVVQVHGWGEGLNSYLVDRFDISGSKREEAPGRYAAMDPAAYAEDWDVLVEAVLQKRYPVQGLPGALIGVKVVACDSGGKEGVTARAYDFWRKMRAMNLSNRFVLVKGDSRLNVPRVHQTYPDTSGRKGRIAQARGDVPVYLLNVNVLKDGVHADIARDIPGPGYAHFAKWLVEPGAPTSRFFEELLAESKDEDGRWVMPAGAKRNESLDLYVYNRALCVILGAEKIDWSNPPEWAKPINQQHAVSREDRARRLSELSRSLNG